MFGVCSNCKELLFFVGNGIWHHAHGDEWCHLKKADLLFEHEMTADEAKAYTERT